MLEAFRYFDANGSGYLDYRELRDALSYYGLDLSSAAAREVVLRYDAEWLAVLRSTAALFSCRRGRVALDAEGRRGHLPGHPLLGRRLRLEAARARCRHALGPVDAAPAVERDLVLSNAQLRVARREPQLHLLRGCVRAWCVCVRVCVCVCDGRVKARGGAAPRQGRV